ncbi:MAG: hypothetical protein ACLRRE_02705 [[Eubacterium] siraeum]
MKVAFIYQAKEPPVINGIKKPMKPGGYSDGCADMAYCLRNGGTDVITPAENPDVHKDTDWCFPDTHEGNTAGDRQWCGHAVAQHRTL